jgi:hypothetical protein
VGLCRWDFVRTPTEVVGRDRELKFREVRVIQEIEHIWAEFFYSRSGDKLREEKERRKVENCQCWKRLEELRRREGGEGERALKKIRQKRKQWMKVENRY